MWVTPARARAARRASGAGSGAVARRPFRCTDGGAGGGVGGAAHPGHGGAAWHQDVAEQLHQARREGEAAGADGGAARRAGDERGGDAQGEREVLQRQQHLAADALRLRQQPRRGAGLDAGPQACEAGGDAARLQVRVELHRAAQRAWRSDHGVVQPQRGAQRAVPAAAAAGPAVPERARAQTPAAHGGRDAGRAQRHHSSGARVRVRLRRACGMRGRV